MALPMTTEAEAELTREAIIRKELQELTNEYETLNKYRDYYSGNQTISFGTTKFQESFGDSFEGFRDNWCGVVVDALADKLEVIGLRIGRTKEDIDAWAGVGQYLWERFLNVDVDSKQEDLHTGVFVEGRSVAIIWPDTETGFSLNWNPAQLVRVRYNDDDPDRIDWAVKRWQTADGTIYVTFYTPKAIYKYEEQKGEGPANRSDRSLTAVDSIPDVTGPGGLIPREVPGEEWPLPNPFGEVPVVEFPNKGGESELLNVVPMQDAINYTIQQMFVAGEFSSFRQKAMVTKQGAPDGGWSNHPGRIWHLEPMVDAEGKFVMPDFHEFGSTDPSGFIKSVEMYLQHVAMTTKTPMRMFFQDSRGGRGDAPSGESLKVEDKPLLDKVRKRSTTLGNRWYRLMRLGYKALLGVPEFRAELNDLIPEGASPEDGLPFGEIRWRDDKTEYRSAAIAEAKALIDIGWPEELAWKAAGFSPEEIAEAKELAEVERERKMEEEQQHLEMQAKVSGGNDESGDGIVRPRQARSGPRPTNQ